MPKVRRTSACLTLIAAFVAMVGIGPAAPAPDGTPRFITVRQKFFGKENVDPVTGQVRKDRVILSWFGVASYAASFNGHVVLVDAWVPRGSHSGYVPTTVDEVTALGPEYVFVGHGDFDHAADAAEIVKGSGATLVGTPEHCDSVAQQAGTKIECVAASPRGATPGIRKELNLIPGVDITAVSHIHSSFESPETQEGYLPCPPVWNARDTAEHPPSPEDFGHLMQHLPDARGGNVLYQFRVGNFALAWHDTTGKIDKDAPQVVRTLKTLPQTDIQFGAVLAFGQATNCLRSLGLYIDALAPKVFAATHHDNFTYAIGANAKDLEPLVREELARIPKAKRPKLLYSYDREDYLNPGLFTFDPAARSWR